MPAKALQKPHAITVRFAGDSGDGMQLTGSQFTDTAAIMGNDFATLPDYPAEIRAPAGTLAGVSSFQIQFSDSVIFTPGDLADVLVAMNPAALKVNLNRVRTGGLVLVNENTFDAPNLKKANIDANPLEDGSLQNFQVVRAPLSELTRNALAEHSIKPTEVQRCKNFFALGMMFWLYNRDMQHTLDWIHAKFSRRPEIAAANVAALKAGYNYADIIEALPVQYHVNKAKLEPGTYRKISGNEALAIGFVAAAHQAKKTLFYGSYPITPASTILHELSRRKNFGVKTFQAEDEIAAMGSVIGASFGGHIGVCGTSGPGMCLKAEAIGLAVMAELPLVIVNVQRGGPSTGMPTKTEQGDLLQAMFGRNGESPLVILAPKSPSDCFIMAYEAVRISTKHMVPVVLLSEGYLAESSEPWKLPKIEDLPAIEIRHPAADDSGEKFLPYVRDEQTLARPWAIPGTPGLQHRIGGLVKEDKTGNVNYDPENNELMVRLRQQKVERVAEDIPDIVVEGAQSSKLLVLGWGGSYGPIFQASQEVLKEGAEVAYAQLTYINPFPKNISEVVHKFERVLVPELNRGQLLFLLRNAFPEVDFQGVHKMKGQPFLVTELVEKIKENLQ